MSIYILYIGKEPSIKKHFKFLLEDIVHFASDNGEAEKLLKEKDESLSLIIFFEKDNVKYDVPKIDYIKSRYPKAYIILVAVDVEKDEISKYQKAGISDTAPPDVSGARLRNGIDFVAKNQAVISAVAQDREPLGIYKCPIWKRLFDILFSLTAIILLSPLLILTSITILLESRWPIIYKSKRVGSNYVVFNFLKFRSMYKDADSRLKEFMKLNQYSDTKLDSYFDYSDETTIPVSETIVGDNYYVSDDDVVTESTFLRDKNLKQKNNFVKYENDPRITRFGKIIRKFSIDELPQLINILKGDMSVVGNRPLPLYEAEMLTSDQYIDRFMGPSGLTGLWQVEKRGDAGKLSPEERKQLDVYYVNNYSFWMDIKIIFKTFTAFIQKENV